MNVSYRSTKDFTLLQLQELYLSVGWKSGNNPYKLQISMKNSHSVFSAWDGGKLIGLVNCLSDGIMTVYINNLLVRPEYQGNGIGRNLMNMLIKEYEEFDKKLLIADDKKLDFYKNLGFKKGEDVIPMIFTK